MFLIYLWLFVCLFVFDLKHTYTVRLYFHAILNHMRAGLIRYHEKHFHNKSDSTSDNLPLIVFDHFEALPAALRHCQNEKNREMLSFIIYSISQFASSICHDNGLAHVLFVGDEYFTMKKSDLDFDTQQFDPNQLQTGTDQSFGSWLLVGDDNDNGDDIESNAKNAQTLYRLMGYLDKESAMNRVGCMEHLSPSIYNHCEYWSIGGIEYSTAVDWLSKRWNEKLNLKLNLDSNETESQNARLHQLAKKMITCIGNKPFTIEKICDATVKTVTNINTSSQNVNVDSDIILNKLAKNVDEIVAIHIKKNFVKQKELLRLDRIPPPMVFESGIDIAKIEKENQDKAMEKLEFASQVTEDTVKATNEQEEIGQLPQLDQYLRSKMGLGNSNDEVTKWLIDVCSSNNVLYRMMNSGLVTRYHGPILARNEKEIENYQFRRCMSGDNAVHYSDE